jgi:hypothetical protein
MHGLVEEEVEVSLAFLRGKLAEVGIAGPGR